MLERTVVVLDDDPTGTQTVHGVPVLTVWDVESLTAEFAAGTPAFFVLTNSRALLAEEAGQLNAEIGENLVEAARRAGRRFSVVSRSDSTLRGHFPGEVEALMRGLGMPRAPIVLCPYFEAGGRVTIGDVHYLREGETLTPVSETEFARDSAFGYRASNLRDWVVEKSGGSVRHEGVHSISLEEVRQGGANQVAQKLAALTPGDICILNCERRTDLEALVAGALWAEEEGALLLYRTAASFAAAFGGIAPRPLLTAEELGLPAGGGLVVVGSYVRKTTEQLEALRAVRGLVFVELSAYALLTDAGREGSIAHARTRIEEAIRDGSDAVLFTSRRLITSSDAAESLAIGKCVSEGLVAVVRDLETRPRYLLTKGGITSSDIATKALGVKRAEVLGQVAPGVAVWRTGPESRFPSLAYIVFPGNVGGPETLAQVVTVLKSS